MRPSGALFTLFLAGILVMTGTAVAQDESDEAQEHAMQAQAAAAAPGEHHEHLAVREGAWTARAKILSIDGGEPVESTTDVQSEMIMGGRYLKSVHSGDLMGQRFLGLGYDGYDNVTDQHESVWLDNMGTAILIMRGSCSQEGKRITTYGEMVDPATGERKEIEEVTTIHNSRMYTFEMSEKGEDGKYVKTLEIVLTKK